MKIYVNNNHEIKALNECNDESLVMYEVDREELFNNKSDFMILNYCYKVSENRVEVYPSKDLNMLNLLDKEVIDKINIILENQRAILSGDMQTLAYNLYPEDFNK